MERVQCESVILVWHIDLAKPRQDGFQQLMFVLYHDEKPGGMTKQLNASSQCGLCINCQFIRIIHHDAFEEIVFVALDVCLCKLFQFVSDKLDTLSMCTVHKHDIVFNLGTIRVVDAIDKVADDCSLTRTRRSMKDNVGDFSNIDEIIKFLIYQVIVFHI
jgi:hypothetical protein